MSRDPPEQILCPVDFSDCSRRALEHAAVLARWFEAELTILHVRPAMPTMFALEPAVSAVFVRSHGRFSG